jgi:hypothetical protein
MPTNGCKILMNVLGKSVNSKLKFTAENITTKPMREMFSLMKTLSPWGLLVKID